MWKDEIVEEVRKVREENAEKFDFDLKAIYEDAVKRQKSSGKKLVSFSRKLPMPSPNSAEPIINNR